MMFEEFERKADAVYEEYMTRHKPTAGWPKYLFTAADAYKSVATTTDSDDLIEVLDEIEWDHDAAEVILRELAKRAEIDFPDAYDPDGLLSEIEEALRGNEQN